MKKIITKALVGALLIAFVNNMYSKTSMSNHQRNILIQEFNQQVATNTPCNVDSAQNIINQLKKKNHHTNYTKTMQAQLNKKHLEQAQAHYDTVTQKQQRTCKKCHKNIKRLKKDLAKVKKQMGINNVNQVYKFYIDAQVDIHEQKQTIWELENS